jgi:hypothetical protein
MFQDMQFSRHRTKSVSKLIATRLNIYYEMAP